MYNRIFSNLSLAGIIIVVGIGTLLTAVATQNGLGLSSDSLIYVNTARVLLPDSGWAVHDIDLQLLNRIIKHYLPLYPALLAAVGFYTDPYVAGRWLHLAFPGLLALLIWIILHQHQKSPSSVFYCIAIIILAPHILWLNWYALTEIPFLLLQFLSMIALNRYLFDKNPTALVGAVVFISLACLTRYAGVVMAPALAITIWYANADQPLIRKTLTCIAAASACLLPVMIYIYFPFFSIDEIGFAGRDIAWHPPRFLEFCGLALLPVIYSLSPIWCSFSTKIVYAIGAGVVILTLVINKIRNQMRHSLSYPMVHFQLFLGLCIVGYLMLIFITRCFLSYFIWLNVRLFAPVFVWTVCLITLTGAPSDKQKYNFRKTAILFAAFFLMVGIYTVGSTKSAINLNRYMGNMSNLWKNSAALAQSTVTKNQWVVSNLPLEVFHYTKIPATPLPLFYDSSTGEKNHNYYDEMLDIKNKLQERKGIMLYINPSLSYTQPLKMIHFYASPKECIEMLDLKIVLRDKNVIILEPKSAVKN